MFDRQRYGPWAIVAGASEGVGVSFSRQLAAAGFHLVLLARKGDILEELAKALRADHGVEVRALPLDLTASDMLDRLRAATDDIEVGLVVYNAGASHGMGRFLEARLEDSLHLIKLNPIGQVSLSHHYGKAMAARGRGGIILIGSLAGNAGSATVVPYCGAKAFTQIFSEALWCELKPLGVDVMCYVLGATMTPARARLGHVDKPDQIVSDPDDVARDCLVRITEGPVLMPAHLEQSFQEFSCLPRREAAEKMSAMILKAKE